MNKFSDSSVSGVLAALLIGFAGGQPASAETPTWNSTEAPAAAAPAVPGGRAGKVIESHTAGGYTYVHVDDAAGGFWAAVPQTAVEVGDDVVVPGGMLMTNYTSKSLNRTFEEIYFAGALEVGGAGAAPVGGMPAAQPPAGHPAVGGMHGGGHEGRAAPAIDFTGIVPPEGGRTVAEIFDGRAEFSGKAVTVRGKVVKINRGIRGKNWVHLQDGTTGMGGEDDLTVITGGDAEVGSTILAEGTVTLNRDFGFGYKYDLIIDEAQVTVE